MELHRMSERVCARHEPRRSARFLLACVAVAVGVCSFGSATAGAAAGPSPHAALFDSPFGCFSCHTARDVLLVAPSDANAQVAPVDPEICVGCHIDGAHGAPKVYSGDASHYFESDGFGHNGSNVSCLDCHSIHGPSVGHPLLAGKLLKTLSYQPQAVATLNSPTSSHDTALSAWCTGCHEMWPNEPLQKAGGAPSSSANHPFAVADHTTAWRDCLSCFDCHAAAGFPHYTPGADAGLVGAASADAPRVGVAKRNLDGVCLGCHIGGSGASAVGVGRSY